MNDGFLSLNNEIPSMTFSHFYTNEITFEADYANSVLFAELSVIK